jgi:hypothetical protein
MKYKKTTEEESNCFGFSKKIEKVHKINIFVKNKNLFIDLLIIKKK